MKVAVSLLLAFCIGYAGELTRADNMVTDSGTNLQWQDNGDEKPAVRKWSDALAYCENLSLGGFSDWKLPDIEALRSITRGPKKMPVTKKIFKQTRPDFYWSSTTDSENEHKAMAIHFGLGNEVSDFKYDEYFVRCVRRVR